MARKPLNPELYPTSPAHSSHHPPLTHYANELVTTQLFHDVTMTSVDSLLCDVMIFATSGLHERSVFGLRL